jgi:hypothetical protein
MIFLPGSLVNLRHRLPGSKIHPDTFSASSEGDASDGSSP